MVRMSFIEKDRIFYKPTFNYSTKSLKGWDLTHFIGKHSFSYQLKKKKEPTPPPLPVSDTLEC